MRILVVEDEEKLATLISRALQKAGHQVETRSDGALGLSAVSGSNFDLLVLDVNLPVMDGFAVLKEMRAARNQTRVLLLTARGTVEDRVSGLRAGADDYLTKPFAMEELLARIDVIGRRAPSPNQGEVIDIGNIRMDIRKHKVTRAGVLINLSPREFELLQIFMQEPGRTFSREEICERIWEREHEYDTRTVEIFIMRLRKKLSDDPSEILIETVRGVGYMMHPAVPVA
jgi:DNA-binding response OmpR family regulator